MHGGLLGGGRATVDADVAAPGLVVVVLVAALVVTVATAVDYVMKALTLRSTSDRARMKRERKAAGGR